MHGCARYFTIATSQFPCILQNEPATAASLLPPSRQFWNTSSPDCFLSSVPRTKQSTHIHQLSQNLRPLPATKSSSYLVPKPRGVLLTSGLHPMERFDDALDLAPPEHSIQLRKCVNVSSNCYYSRKWSTAMLVSVSSLKKNHPTPNLPREARIVRSIH